jgi:2'-5' RNA ligase
MRVFVALPLPESVRLGLSMLRGGLPGIRWTAPENIHVTLRFIGEADGGVVEDIDGALAAIRAPGFTVEIAGTGHFGNGERVRVIWAGVGRGPGLMHLHDKIERALARLGVAPEKQKYTPHVTIGRGKGAKVPRLRDFIEGHSLFRAPPVEAERFALYSSFATSSGPLYREERSYALLPP